MRVGQSEGIDFSRPLDNPVKKARTHMEISQWAQRKWPTQLAWMTGQALTSGSEKTTPRWKSCIRWVGFWRSILGGIQKWSRSIFHSGSLDCCFQIVARKKRRNFWKSCNLWYVFYGNKMLVLYINDKEPTPSELGRRLWALGVWLIAQCYFWMDNIEHVLVPASRTVQRKIY